jgi:hypothetical protein
VWHPQVRSAFDVHAPPSPPQPTQTHTRTHKHTQTRARRHAHAHVHASPPPPALANAPTPSLTCGHSLALACSHRALAQQHQRPVMPRRTGGRRRRRRPDLALCPARRRRVAGTSARPTRCPARAPPPCPSPPCRGAWTARADRGASLLRRAVAAGCRCVCCRCVCCCWELLLRVLLLRAVAGSCCWERFVCRVAGRVGLPWTAAVGCSRVLHLLLAAAASVAAQALTCPRLPGRGRLYDEPAVLPHPARRPGRHPQP